MDALGFEPRAFRMRSGCDTTTPCALDTCEHNEHMSFVRVNCQQFTHAHQPAFLTNWNGQKNDGRMFAMWPKLSHPKQITLCGTRTHNLRIRSPTPCPLGQGGLISCNVSANVQAYTCATKRKNKFRHRDSNPGRSGESRVS